MDEQPAQRVQISMTPAQAGELAAWLVQQAEDAHDARLVVPGAVLELLAALTEVAAAHELEAAPMA